MHVTVITVKDWEIANAAIPGTAVALPAVTQQPSTSTFLKATKTIHTTPNFKIKFILPKWHIEFNCFKGNYVSKVCINLCHYSNNFINLQGMGIIILMLKISNLQILIRFTTRLMNIHHFSIVNLTPKSFSLLIKMMCAANPVHVHHQKAYLDGDYFTIIKWNGWIKHHQEGS